MTKKMPDPATLSIEGVEWVPVALIVDDILAMNRDELVERLIAAAGLPQDCALRVAGDESTLRDWLLTAYRLDDQRPLH